jgi:hypothetical protein
LGTVEIRLVGAYSPSFQAFAIADQKDDPTASTYALEFLLKHPEITSESVT